jgi:predicted RNase H-like HicB family nuclease
MDAHSYSIAVNRETEDGTQSFVATVREFPHVAVFADTPGEAYDEAVLVIQDLLDRATEEGRSAPQPLLPDPDYTGRVTLRLPIALHRRLATVAELESVSLNLLIVSYLAECAGHHDRAALQASVVLSPMRAIGTSGLSFYGGAFDFAVSPRNTEAHRGLPTVIAPAITRADDVELTPASFLTSGRTQ